jgi:hypothetical protein
MPKDEYWRCDGCKILIKKGYNIAQKPIRVDVIGDNIMYVAFDGEAEQSLTYDVCYDCWRLIESFMSRIESKKGEIRE